jgi:hypothetical protein
LEKSPPDEKKTFIRSFVKEVKLKDDEVLLTHVMPKLPERVSEEKLPVLSIVRNGGR